MNPVVAVVGRPNVGKSTLVNRILGRREAIVEEHPGVTRDRKAVDAEWQGRRFTLLDTGGWSTSGDELDAKVSAQAERAVREADAVLFVVDASVGVTSDDEQVARVLYSADVPVFVVANKVDHPNQADSVWELLALGLGDPHQVSALHGRGTGDLLEEVVARLEEAGAGSGRSGPPAGDGPEGIEPEQPGQGLAAAAAAAYSVVLVGRPNAGKSTLFNRLIGEERAIVHDVPGTTRDAIDTLIETDEGPVRFIDTAGMRRRARIDSGTEYYSLVRALRAVDSADVALLVIDCSVGVTHQDQRLAERVDAAGCPIVILLNKWDRVGAEARRDLGLAVKDRLAFLGRPAGAAHQRPQRQGRDPAVAFAEHGGGRVPHPHPHPAGERGGAGGPERPSRARRRPRPVRDAGGHRPAHLRAVRQSHAAPHVPALPRAQAARAVRSRRHRHQDQGPSPRRVAQPVDMAAAATSSPAGGRAGCGEQP